MNRKITIIGAGHMGTAIITGFCSVKENNLNIIATDHSSEKLKFLEKKFKIKTYADNIEAVKNAEWVVIAVKPNAVKEVLQNLKKSLSGKLIISVVAGVSISKIGKFIENPNPKIIRLMPNIPVSIKEGVIGFFANKNVLTKEKEECKKTFSLLGEVFEVDWEKELNYFSLIPGCGPALVSYCIEMFSKSGKLFNLEKNESDKIAMQTFLGTLLYLHKTKKTPKELQKAVATKGGVTERIIQTLDKNGFDKKFAESINEGYSKIKKIEEVIV